MFTITHSKLEDLNLHKELNSESAGAYSSFEGRVRNHNDGNKVTALEYEAYESLCVKEAQKIFDEVEKKFNVIEARCVHRIGKIPVGAMAVWIGVIAGHREDSFRACRYIIDELKTRLPIWKKEYYENGGSDWIACTSCDTHMPLAQSK